MKDELKNKRKELKKKKRELYSTEFKSSDERKSAIEGINKEFRAMKRSEKNKFKDDIKKEFGV